MMRPIYTLTANLLWETTFTFGSWEPGRTQRAQASSFQVGGKGINVSRMLARLGAPTTAIFFPGGATGAECEQWIRAHGVACQTFPVTASTRAGLVVRAAGRPETTFLGPDAPLEVAALRACAKYLDACPADGVLAICGSVPGWDSEACAPLRAAINRRLARGPVVADTYGPPLAWLSERPLAWAKVNRVEFDTLFTDDERKQPVAERLIASFERWPVRAWIVTDGPRPVWLAERGRPPVSLLPPAVVEVSSTGSGDVLHACLLHAVFHHGQTLFHALELALPYAAANAAHAAVTDFPLNNLPEFGSIPQGGGAAAQPVPLYPSSP